MEYFGSVSSIEQLKSEYLNYLNKWKGTDVMDEIREQYEDLLVSLGVELNKQIDKENETLPEAYRKEHFNADKDMFADTLEKVVDFNMTIEIIGQWIWCFDSYEYHEQLKEIGFWYSKSKKAWVFSGTKKKMIRSRNSINDLREKWGSDKIKDRKEA